MTAGMLLNRFMFYLNARLTQELNPIGKAVATGIYHATYTCLDDEFGTLNAGSISNVEGGAIGVVARACYLSDGICLGVKHIGQGKPVGTLAHIGEAGGRSVEAIADNHVILDDESAHLAAGAV